MFYGVIISLMFILQSTSKKSIREFTMEKQKCEVCKYWVIWMPFMLLICACDILEGG